jgi:hypothetical protein
MSGSSENSKTRSVWLLSEKTQLRFMAFTFPAAFILGTIGYRGLILDGEPASFMNAMYLSVQLFVLNTPTFSEQVPWTLEIARWVAAGSTGLVLFNAAIHLFQNERDRMLLNRMRNHAVVCGLGRRGMAVVQMLYEEGIHVVAVDKAPEPDILERLGRLGIPLIIGDATLGRTLQEARLDFAESIFTLCPEDTVNCTIAMEANKMSCRSGKTRKCFIHINESDLRNSLQENHATGYVDSNQTICFIDSFGPEAISLLVEKFPLDHGGILPDDPRQVHLIIIGFGRMGRTVAVKASQLGIFANGKNLRISVIDRNAESNQAALLFHHPFITDVADFTFYQQEVLSPETRIHLETWCNEANMIVNVAICFDYQTIVYDVLLNLLPVFNRTNVRVAVRLQESKSFEFLIKGADSNKLSALKIQHFGLEKGFKNLIRPEVNLAEKFAMDIHKAYVALVNDQLKGDRSELEKRKKSGELNDWYNLPEDFRESNRQQAAHIFFKVRACGLEIVGIEDPRPAINEFEKASFETLAIMEHSRWIAERKVNNWKYGDPSDKPNRINKNIVKWNKLTDEIKRFDYDVVARIPVLLSSAGKKVVAKKPEKRNN